MCHTAFSVIQDALYWLRYFPQHKYSLFIGSKLPAKFVNTKCQQMIDQAKEIADA